MQRRNVQGDLAGSSLAQINAAKLLVEAGADRLDADLTQAVIRRRSLRSGRPSSPFAVIWLPGGRGCSRLSRSAAGEWPAAIDASGVIASRPRKASSTKRRSKSLSLASMVPASRSMSRS